jgi:hypothetical protein
MIDRPRPHLEIEPAIESDVLSPQEGWIGDPTKA